MRSFRDPAGWSDWIPATFRSDPPRSMWVTVSCNRARQHVLVEGHLPDRTPILAAITAAAAAEACEGLRYRHRRSVTVPALGTGLQDREFSVSDPGDGGAVLAIDNRFGPLGRWSVHPDRVPELSWALKYAHALATGRNPLDVAAAGGGSR
ncbi:hypothetical protein [Actinoalloteichus hymeniacidonis]|uniref:Uncharacterized protein n=1 Tax=Actinoalloteichus hymeniacidonis TaxID=340345 RepID=A0AAC9HRM6_9PSEU|nr:hypothetical protein [Actinoalloteichus hymeniacidonis]AOS64088.1 hypothetical protein TL08_16440 [Actinoalloteichus hymeniacidonis]MBB5907849.1 hypothetical protein [Actinoalloteichus hymeniacidonis]